MAYEPTACPSADRENGSCGLPTPSVKGHVSKVHTQERRVLTLRDSMACSSRLSSRSVAAGDAGLGHAGAELIGIWVRRAVDEQGSGYSTVTQRIII